MWIKFYPLIIIFEKNIVMEIIDCDLYPIFDTFANYYY